MFSADSNPFEKPPVAVDDLQALTLFGGDNDPISLSDAQNALLNEGYSSYGVFRNPFDSHKSRVAYYDAVRKLEGIAVQADTRDVRVLVSTSVYYVYVNFSVDSRVSSTRSALDSVAPGGMSTDKSLGVAV